MCFIRLRGLLLVLHPLFRVWTDGIVPGDSLYDKKVDGEIEVSERPEKERALEEDVVMADASAVVA